MKKSLLDFVTQANPALIKEHIFCQLGRIILLIDLNELKFKEEIHSRTKRAIMLLNDLPKKSKKDNNNEIRIDKLGFELLL